MPGFLLNSLCSLRAVRDTVKLIYPGSKTRPYLSFLKREELNYKSYHGSIYTIIYFNYEWICYLATYEVRGHYKNEKNACNIRAFLESRSSTLSFSITLSDRWRRLSSSLSDTLSMK